METEREVICIQPQYVKKFQCEGSKCQAKCCCGWQIVIDEDTCRRYAGISDRELADELKRKVIWHKASGTQRMAMRKDGSCPMLGKDLLCRIQKRCGEEYLSDTCAEFPRRTFLCDGFAERALSLVCPVAAELALMDTKPMVLEQITLNTTRAKSFFPSFLQDRVQGPYLLSLQIGGISILQERGFSLDERLCLLGSYSIRVDRLLENGQGEKIDGLNKQLLLQKPLGYMKAGDFPKAEYFQLLFSLLDDLYGTGIVLYSDDQIDYVPYILRAFSIGEKPKAIAELVKAYRRNYEFYQRFVLEPYRHVLENYLVQEYFNNLYPCRLKGSVQYNYEVFLVFYKFMELFLIALAGVKRENLTANDLLKVIERMAQRTDHASVYLEKVENKLVQYGQEADALMEILLGVYHRS